MLEKISDLKRTISLLVIVITLFLFILTYVNSYNNKKNSLILNLNELVIPTVRPVREHSQNNFSWAKPLQCYEGSGNIIEELDYSEPKIGESIFFLLTSCPNNSTDIMLNARQACAIESTALMHWDKDIYLLSVAPIGVLISETNNLAVKALAHYPNIKIRHINFLRYLNDTPLQPLAVPLQNSNWPIPHASDVLRYTTLYKYRGLYLDLDIISLRRMPDDVTDFVGAESRWSLGAGAIRFGNNVTGEEMAQQCAEEIARTFNGKDWGNNGPGVITRVLFKRCQVKTPIELWGKTCKGFKIYSPSYFYALPFAEPQLFFKLGNIQNVTKKLENSFIVHYWNKVTSHMKANEPNIPFYEFANRNCPRVFDSSRYYF